MQFSLAVLAQHLLSQTRGLDVKAYKKGASGPTFLPPSLQQQQEFPCHLIHALQVILSQCEC